MKTRSTWIYCHGERALAIYWNGEWRCGRCGRRVKVAVWERGNK